MTGTRLDELARVVARDGISRRTALARGATLALGGMLSSPLWDDSSALAKLTGKKCKPGHAKCGSSCCPKHEKCITSKTGKKHCKCVEPRKKCGGLCVNVQADGANCGACGHACPSGQTCQAGSCVAPPCTGCMTASGVCVAGVANDSCGAGGGGCQDCTMNFAQPICVNGHCGCQTSADCPPTGGYACDPATNTCTNTCGAGVLCNGGCCTGGGCLQTASQTALMCGSDGGACVDCIGSAQGSRCVGTVGASHCGCLFNTDCVSGNCNTTSQTCV